jgi:hypothetical protein
MIDFNVWLQMGYANGWVGPAVCSTHDGVPMSASEENEFDDGEPCIHVLRLYSTVEEKHEVEENHGASVWRASNAGLTDGPNA